jgi:uncharacterized protein
MARVDLEPKNRSRYRRSPVSMAAIRRWARDLAAKFQPERIILFGSYAHGTPHQDSDVDILVVMPAANEINQSIRLTLAISHPFPLDLIVRTPDNLRRRLKDGDWFLREVMAQGEVLYEKNDGSLGSESRSRRKGSKKARLGSSLLK